jgi:hypothetical protein
MDISTIRTSSQDFCAVAGGLAAAVRMTGSALDLRPECEPLPLGELLPGPFPPGVLTIRTAAANAPAGIYPIIGLEIVTYGMVQTITRQLGLTTLCMLHERLSSGA